jgi:hypothetical protein
VAASPPHRAAAAPAAATTATTTTATHGPATAWHRRGRHDPAVRKDLLLVAGRGPDRGVSATTGRDQGTATHDENTKQST